MAKAYLFIETGEVRGPKKGDWYDNRCVADITRNAPIKIQHTDYDFCKGVDAPIYACHEIEIPEDTKDAYIAFSKDWASLPPFHAVVIPIPKPKKKVKKWRWWADLNGIRVETAQEKSEDEMVDAGMQWHKISSSEVEVEVG